MVPEMIYLEKLHRNTTIKNFFLEMSLATFEWCDCFICAALVKQRDHKAGLAGSSSVVKDLATLCARVAEPFALRNATDKLPRLIWLNGHQCPTSPDAKVISEGGPKHISEKSSLGNNPREAPVIWQEEEKEAPEDPK